MKIAIIMALCESWSLWYSYSYS